MALTGRYTETELGAIAVIATVVAALTWFNTSLNGLSRVTTSGIAWLIAAAILAVGLLVLN